jgi:porphobilinogen deaminase
MKKLRRIDRNFGLKLNFIEKLAKEIQIRELDIVVFIHSTKDYPASRHSKPINRVQNYKIVIS